MNGVGEHVVLLDEEGNAIGTALKREVHHQATPLHLAFSCYVFDSDGSLLVTQRALDKPTWPGVWTNSVCGHPRPGEDIGEAVERRVREELGLRLRDVHLALPAFRYDAVMANGVRENEMCPVFTAVTDEPEQLAPLPDEVEAAVWESWEKFCGDVLEHRREVSPWCAEQVALLRAQEIDQGRLPTGAWSDLPPAALFSRAVP